MPDLAVVQALLDSSIPVVRMVHDHSMYCMRTYKYNYFTRRICTRAFSPYCIFPCMATIARGAAGGRLVKLVSYRQKKRELQLNQRCASFVVYSEYVKGELVRNGFDPKKIMICAPIPMSRGPMLTSSSGERNLILFAGQIIRGKGVDVLLESLARVKTNFRCMIVGEGNHLPYCRRLCANLGLANRVQFHGYVLPADLQRFYFEASVFVMSSLWPEPFGMAGPEAMRFGLPVVAFDAGGISEWLTDGENGFLVPWKDTDRFAARLEELLQNKELAQRMGRRAMETVARFNAAQQIDALEQLFERAAGHQHGEPSPLF
jgi:glycosyltransferase involved in cell wall biosynthesis